jgi:hypothetical protein
MSKECELDLPNSGSLTSAVTELESRDYKDMEGRNRGLSRPICTNPEFSERERGRLREISVR